MIDIRESTNIRKENMACQDFHAKVITKAWKDASFKKKLQTNPRQALEEIGMNIPANVNVKVVEDTNSSYTFVLPVSPASAKNLSEMELDAVAGVSGHCPPIDPTVK